MISTINNKPFEGRNTLKALLSWNNIVVILMNTLMSFNSSKDKNIFLESHATKIRWSLWFLLQNGGRSFWIKIEILLHILWNSQTKCRDKYWEMAVNLASKNHDLDVMYQKQTNFPNTFLPTLLKTWWWGIRIVLDNFQSFVNFGRFGLFLPFRIKGIM